MTLTPTAIASLDSKAQTLEISRSELVEMYGRNLTVKADWEKELAKLEEKYHVRITTPFEKGEPYFAGATPLGQAGFNGRPDFEVQGATLYEAVLNLARSLKESEL